jgi:hypothetical protein
MEKRTPEPTMRPTACATLLALCALAASARADEVVTKTGKTYTGTIVAEDKDTVTVDTATLGQMKVARVDIARIDRAKAPAKDAGAAEAKPAAAKPADDKKEEAAATPSPESPEKAEADAAAKAKAKADAAAAAKAKAEAEEILSAQERDRRRRATRIVRRTDPAATKPAPAAAKPPAPVEEEESKATLSGAQLARVERGSWIVVVQPPKQVEGASGAIAIGRRTYARLESVGAASASMTIPMAAGDERVAVRLADVQRHALVKADASRVSRMVDGIEPGSWLRARLSDGTTVDGVLQEVKDASLTLGRVEADGSIAPVEVASGRLVEVDGLMRSNATRMTLAEVTIGEPFAATMWPDARLVAGTVTERSDSCITLRTSRGATERVCSDGPVAEARRVPLKWRQSVTSIGPKTLARIGCSEEYPDAHVERDLAGVVLAASAFAVTLDTPDGVIVVPYEAVIRLEMSDSGNGDSRPMKKSDRSCSVPVLPGDPASKTQGLDAASGVSAVTDGDVVRHVIVSRPFDGSVFGVRLGDRAVDAQDATDIRFDTVVVPRKKFGAEERPAEMTSNSLESMRVTLLLDAAGSVSAIELTSR